MKRNSTLHIPRWLAKFILNETKTQPNNQQIFLAILEPMSPQEWCRIWIPIIHPDVEAPYPGERSPPGYMKASIMTLCKLTGYSECTVEGWFYGKTYHHTLGILLRCFHILFQFQRNIKISDNTL
ncbi:hypothetical protein NIES267_40550 [Calothrix parasitica NIES-267]|uniref:Uncharacterized protein n=1 Tax=Calothrix parasitica NIES-267 TaxID=1973488 RepID=A0A1Z4LTJ9_9CYAN|nr:hypothetical protein NIES267_40550 [Calothrix parasitica NIES-267]